MLVAVFMAPTLVLAQELVQEGETQTAIDDKLVMLPFAAQRCVLPAAPPPLEDSTYDELVQGKERMGVFQRKLETYRKCLDSTRNDEGLTTGNSVALTEAYNYSVTMEERVAENFNKAIRAYNASIKKD
jgi:hypothetical protein